MAQTTYTARWIFAIDRPPIPAGTITIRADKIVAVEAHGARHADIDLGNAAILPGFVNAHTHLDLTGARGLCPPTPDFTHWLRQVIAFRRVRSDEQVRADINEAILESLRFGTTLLGDISAGGLSFLPLAEAKRRTVIFFELLGLSDERGEVAWHNFKYFEQWLTIGPGSFDPELVLGASLHAPYSVGIPLFQRAAHDANRLVATHLAETLDELELFRSLGGPFVDFLKDLKVWDPDRLVTDPLDVVRMFPRGIFIHGNYLDPATPFLPTQTLVVCPRTHAAFGHSRHPFPAMKVRVALGTDSLASNPDLDILAEARHLRRHYPEVEPALLLRMLTLNGAQALGFDAVAGSLTPGKSADLVVLPLPNAERGDSHDLILESALPVERVMFRGAWRV